MKLFRTVSMVATLTLLSNVLGYIRDAVLASQYGATAATDAYFAAFFIPNTLYLILLSGSISTIFIPIFIQYKQKQGTTEAWYIANNIFNITIAFISVIILLLVLTAQYWVDALFPGFKDATLQLTIELTIILLPMLLFISLSSLETSVLHAHEHFSVPALAPIVANIFVIGIIAVSAHFRGIHTVAIGVTLGMLLQFLIQIPKLRQYGATYKLVFNLRHPSVKHIVKLSLPLILYLFIAYTALVVERNIASTLTEGTVSALNYAVRVFSLPIAFTAGAVGTVIYPRLSLDANNQQNIAFSKNLYQSITVSSFFLIPTSLWIIVNGQAVIQILFGYGKFAPDDVQLTTMILIGYTIGMAATGITRLLQRAAYALQDTTTSLWAEIVSLFFYAMIATILTERLGAFGLGLARGIAFIFVLFFTMGLLFRKHDAILLKQKEVLQALLKYILISGVAIAVPTLIINLLGITFDIFTEQPLIRLMLITSSSFCIYLLLGFAFHIDEVVFLYEKWGKIKARHTG